MMEEIKFQKYKTI